MKPSIFKKSDKPAIIHHRIDSEETPYLPKYNHEPLPTDENNSFAFNMTRSFLAKKSKFLQEHDSLLETEPPIQLSEIYPQMSRMNSELADKPLESKTDREDEIIYSDISRVLRLRTMSSALVPKSGHIEETAERDDLKPPELKDLESYNETNVEVKTMNYIAPEQKPHKKDLFRMGTKEGHEHSATKVFVEHVLESWITRVILTVFTIFALFSSNIGVLIGSDVVNKAFDIIAIIAFFLFVAEFLAALYVEEGYAWSLYFWFDILATASIALHVEFLLEDFFPEKVSHSTQLLEASRAIRLFSGQGAFIELIQLLQVGKIYKQYSKSQSLLEMDEKVEKLRSYSLTLANLEAMGNIEASPKKGGETPKPIRQMRRAVRQVISKPRFSKIVRAKLEEEKDRIANEIKLNARKNAALYRSKKIQTMSSFSEATFLDVQEENIKELRLAKKITFSTLRLVIILVLVLMILLPLFYSDFYYHAPESQEYEMELLKELLDDTNVSNSAKETAIEYFLETQKESQPELVYFQIGSTIYCEDPHVDLEHLKHSAFTVVQITSETRGVMKSITSLHHHEKLKAILGILNILFVCGALAIGALSMGKDANELLMKPFDRIIRKVNQIVHDPLSVKNHCLTKNQNVNKDFLSTATRLERSVVKIVKLLTLGFGEGGSAIITHSIGITGVLSPSQMFGSKQAAIFTICDIHNFIAITEELQEDVMVFVNSVADIVHSMADKYNGLASQNTGDAFLLVWKLDDLYVNFKEDGRIEVIKNKMSQNTADCALISALKTYARLSRDPRIKGYQERLERDVKIDMGFGLHVGWAIEGAIGSDYKIDASYLSSNVSIAKRLEAGTRHYGSPVLFSGELYHMLSEPMKKKCRNIDSVMMNTSVDQRPLDIFTVDFDVEGLPSAKHRGGLTRKEKKKRQKKKKEYVKGIVETGHAYTLLDTDKDLKYMLGHQHKEFDRLFKVGFEAYRKGEWETAKEKFELCLLMNHSDGPSNNLMKYMRGYEFTAPTGWKYREINLKK